jgi:hypothetical protein
LRFHFQDLGFRAFGFPASARLFFPLVKSRISARIRRNCNISFSLCDDLFSANLASFVTFSPLRLSPSPRASITFTSLARREFPAGRRPSLPGVGFPAARRCPKRCHWLIAHTRRGNARSARRSQGEFDRPDQDNQSGGNAIGKRIEIGWPCSGRLEPRLQRLSLPLETPCARLSVLYHMTRDRRFARFRGRDRRMFNPANELCTEEVCPLCH